MTLMRGDVRYLLEGDGEGDPPALLQCPHHLLGGLTPWPAHRGARHHVPSCRPRCPTCLHSLHHVQQQLRGQVRPLPLPLLLLPMLLQALPTMLPGSMSGPAVGDTAGPPRHAAPAVPHLPQLPDNALQRHRGRLVSIDFFSYCSMARSGITRESTPKQDKKQLTWQLRLLSL